MPQNGHARPVVVLCRQPIPPTGWRSPSGSAVANAGPASSGPTNGGRPRHHGPPGGQVHDEPLQGRLGSTAAGTPRHHLGAVLQAQAGHAARGAVQHPVDDPSTQNPPAEPIQVGDEPTGGPRSRRPLDAHQVMLPEPGSDQVNQSAHLRLVRLPPSELVLGHVTGPGLSRPRAWPRSAPQPDGARPGSWPPAWRQSPSPDRILRPPGCTGAEGVREGSSARLTPGRARSSGRRRPGRCASASATLGASCVRREHGDPVTPANPVDSC